MTLMNLPDKDLSREAWLDIVKPVDMLGRLDKIPARSAETLREKKTAQVQNYWLSRRSYAMPNTDWHERIFQSERRGIGYRLSEDSGSVAS